MKVKPYGKKICLQLFINHIPTPEAKSTSNCTKSFSHDNLINYSTH